MRKLLIAFFMCFCFLVNTCSDPAKAATIAVDAVNDFPQPFSLMKAFGPNDNPLVNPLQYPQPFEKDYPILADNADLHTSSAVPVNPVIETITLSFAGDCTIGDDEKYTWNTFDEVYQREKNPAYFFSEVQSVFAHDDLTFINFEGTLTKATQKAEKEYRFKGDPEYIAVLKRGSIEAVTLANNHSMDYLDEGFNDTAKALQNANIPYTYFEASFIRDIKGMKIGFLGYKGWEHEERSNKLLIEQVKAMRQQGVSFIVANYHWGDQMSYVPNNLQRRMAHFAIDHGVDLVIGHHPHVLQGMEVYKGRSILYSLGNFCFGGAPNPKDKDTIIYQHILSFDVTHQTIIASKGVVIPAKVSSDPSRNNYQPIIATDKEKKRIESKFEEISRKIK